MASPLKRVRQYVAELYGRNSESQMRPLLSPKPGSAACAFAEVTASVCLAGELSIIGALCAGDFARAHKVLARNRLQRQALRLDPPDGSAAYA